MDYNRRGHFFSKKCLILRTVKFSKPTHGVCFGNYNDKTTKLFLNEAMPVECPFDWVLGFTVVLGNIRK
jgi:hypothetical protein